MATHEKNSGQGGENVLDTALLQWKTAERPAAGLSEAMRGEIVRAALAGRPDRTSYRPLLGIIPRRILAGAIPVMAATAVLLVLAEKAGDDRFGRPLTVRATKRGDDVVFTIANGGRPHRVVKSSVPTSFDPSTAVTVRDGAYRDAAADGADLVFYRID